MFLMLFSSPSLAMLDHHHYYHHPFVSRVGYIGNREERCEWCSARQSTKRFTRFSDSANARLRLSWLSTRVAHCAPSTHIFIENSIFNGNALLPVSESSLQASRRYHTKLYLSTRAIRALVKRTSSGRFQVESAHSNRSTMLEVATTRKLDTLRVTVQTIELRCV